MLIDDIRRYIELRRSLGFKLKQTAKLLESFAHFAEARDERHIRAQTALAWAAAASTPDMRYRRITDVIRVARFLHAEDPAHEVPPSGVFASHRKKIIPYIFTPDDLVRFLDAAREMQRHEPIPARQELYVVLFGVIAATGLRISEALNLRLADVLPGGILHIRKTKFGKSRFVPLHPTVQEVLNRYLALRREVVAEDDHLFLSEGKRGIYYSVAQRAFHDILRLADIAPGRARRPRIHDLRHTFATRVLEQCDTGRDAIARHTVALMTYMGHSNLRYTYWYLQRTPELMADIAAAAEVLTAGGRP